MYGEDEVTKGGRSRLFRGVLSGALLLTVVLATEGWAAGFALKSGAFQNGGTIPVKYSCNADGTSPPLSWSGAPNGTEAFAMVLDDPDAPGGTFTHWTIWNIKASRKSLKEGNVPPEAEQGKNHGGRVGYFPPCPPAEDPPHRYVFTLYALDAELGLASGASVSKVKKAIKAQKTASAKLVGQYDA